MAAEAEARPDAVIISLSFVNAFNSMLRSAVREAVWRRLNDVLPFAAVLCGGRARHWFFDDAGGNPVRSERGVDQCCHLSPAFFACAIADALVELDAHLREADPQARGLAYLDDVYIVNTAPAAPAAFAATRALFEPLGLELNRAKCHAWCPAGEAVCGKTEILYKT